jgi:hypothetical protein
MKPEAARALELTDRKSFLAFWGVGRKSGAESVRFHGRRVTKGSQSCENLRYRILQQVDPFDS